MYASHDNHERSPAPKETYTCVCGVSGAVAGVFKGVPACCEMFVRSSRLEKGCRLFGVAVPLPFPTPTSSNTLREDAEASIRRLDATRLPAFIGEKVESSTSQLTGWNWFQYCIRARSAASRAAFAAVSFRQCNRFESVSLSKWSLLGVVVKMCSMAGARWCWNTLSPLLLHRLQLHKTSI